MLIEGVYNYNIVIVSIIVAVIATFSSLHIIEKMSYETGKGKYFWLLSGSFVMGGGTWATHYIGMLAFEVPVETTHDMFLTVLSVCVSMGSFFLAFYFIMSRLVKLYQFLLSGFFVGVGIIAMHYIGMAAVDIPAEVVHEPIRVVVSILIAFGASFITLKIFLTFRHQTFSMWLKWVAAMIMGGAIYLSHYVGMKSITFYLHEDAILAGQELDKLILYSIIIIIIFILLNSWAAMLFDHHVLKRMAFKDPLTGLFNRNEMKRYFDQLNFEREVSILFLDLDQFKSINDQYGHDVGDSLIQEVAERLKEFINYKQFIYRIGGDEFLIIVESNKQAYIEELAEEILKSVKEIYYIDEHEMYMTVSMGIVISDVSTESSSVLLKQADTAMYRSKTYGKNRYCVYDKVMDKEVYRRSELEKDIRIAIEQGEFRLVYQPKWNVKEDCLAGFEALLRWDHPKFGIVSPAEFIPIAERTRAIIPITLWVLEEACRQSKKWEKREFSQPISVNFSARMFELEDLAEQVQAVLYKTELDPDLLELEITESMILEDVARVTEQLEKIRHLGVKISMDDFGTGYSSIGMLDQLPLDTLKLDRLFLNDIESESKRNIVKTIIVMAESLGLEVIAEGVEVQQHVDILTELGCYLLQGYYYSKPMRVEEVQDWVRHTSQPSCFTSMTL